jgi:hypothetical protein
VTNKGNIKQQKEKSRLIMLKGSEKPFDQGIGSVTFEHCVSSLWIQECSEWLQNVCLKLTVPKG